MWLVLVAFVFVVCVLFVKARFWVRQPVRLWWQFPQKGVIQGIPPSKYVDHVNVVSVKHEVNSNTDALVEHIQTQTNDVYFPSTVNITTYFVDAYISVYNSVYNSVYTETETAIEGCIVSRPVELQVDGSWHRAFYHETMTSEKDDITKRLLSTHSLNLSNVYPKAPTVFTTTIPLFFVQPVLKYDVIWVQTRVFRKYRLPDITYLKITENNVHTAVEWWKEHTYGVQMVPTVAQLVSWLQTKTASIYFVLQNGIVLGSFYFRKTMMVERNKGVIDCCGAIFPHDTTLLFQTLSTLLFRARRVNSIVRLHASSTLTLLPNIPYFKKTTLYYYLYRYKGPACLPPSDSFIY